MPAEPAALASIARSVLAATDSQDTLDESLASLPDERLVAWTRGVLEHMRAQGAIEHEWFRAYIQHDGNRYHIWGGRPRGQGMPAFPKGRSAPAYPRIGPAAPIRDPLLDPVTTPRSWYARWTARTLGVTAGHGARLARLLLERLARADVLHAVPTDSGGTVFTIPASSGGRQPDHARGDAGRAATCSSAPSATPSSREQPRSLTSSMVPLACSCVAPGSYGASRAGTTSTAIFTHRKTCAGSSPGSTPACSTTSLG